jgi:excisionase family DNA binding protein
MTKETKSLETLYSVQEAARKLGGVSKFTLYAWMRRGTLERTRVGGRVMVRESSLLKLLERGDKLEAARREGKMLQECAAHNG